MKPVFLNEYRRARAAGFSPARAIYHARAYAYLPQVEATIVLARRDQEACR